MTLGRQGGGALVVALFLIVTLAVVGTVAVRLTAVGQHSVSLSLLSDRALMAARSGVQWAAHRALVSGVCASASVSFTEAGLNGIAVDISCTSSTHPEGGAVTTVYHLEAVARVGIYGEPNYVSRRLSAVVSDSS